MDDYLDSIDHLWYALLSRQVDLVRKAYHSLQEDEKQAILKHLQQMASQEGWHPEQRLSAQQALLALGDDLDR